MVRMFVSSNRLFAYSEYTKAPIVTDGCKKLFDQTHRSSFGTLPHGAGCRAVNELVSRALFIGRGMIPHEKALVNTRERTGNDFVTRPIEMLFFD